MRAAGRRRCSASWCRPRTADDQYQPVGQAAVPLRHRRRRRRRARRRGTRSRGPDARDHRVRDDGRHRACDQRLNELQALGVRLAMDDFGTGYSSLSSLSRFPIDILKMDRSLLVAGETPITSGLATAVLGLGDTFNLAVVAEGIEFAEECQRCGPSAASLGRASTSQGRWSIAACWPILERVGSGGCWRRDRLPFHRQADATRRPLAGPGRRVQSRPDPRATSPTGISACSGAGSCVSARRRRDLPGGARLAGLLALVHPIGPGPVPSGIAMTVPDHRLPADRRRRRAIVFAIGDG